MLRYLIFFPSITFGFLKTEIFPWAIIYSVFKARSLNHRFLLLLALIITSALYTTYKYDGIYLAESVRSILAYINPLLLFYTIMRLQSTEITKLISVLRYVLIFFIILGVVQATALAAYFDELIKMLVPRASGDQLGGGRGVTLLSSEPSRAAIETIFIYAAWRVMANLRSLHLLIFDILISLFIIAVIKSAVGLALLLLYLFFVHRLKILLFIALFAPIALIFSIESHSIDVATRLITSASVDDFWNLLVNASGFRVVSVISAYHHAITNIFGSGVGAWPISSTQAMHSAGFYANEINYFIYNSGSDFIGVRPVSYMANIALDMGILGTSLFVFALFPYLSRAWSCGHRLRPLLFLFLFSILFIGAVGNPVPWLALAIALRWHAFKEIVYSPKPGQSFIPRDKPRTSHAI